MAYESSDSAEDKIKGFHCLDSWDGGKHRDFEQLVKRQLKDPGSMETYATRITPVNADGNHMIFMEFGAKNSFGGMVRSTARGSVDNETCNATFLAIE